MSAAGNEAGLSPTPSGDLCNATTHIERAGCPGGCPAAREPRRHDGLFLRGARLCRHGARAAATSTWTATASRCAVRWRCIRTSSCSPATRTWTSTSTSTRRSWKSAAAATGRSRTRSTSSASSASSRPRSTSDGSTTMTTASCSARACAAWWRRSSSWKAASTIAISTVGDETTIVFEGRYFFMDQLAGGLSVSIGDDRHVLGLNVRLTF